MQKRTPRNQGPPERGQPKRRDPKVEEAKRRKAEELTGKGFWQAPTPGTCCLCNRGILTGQWIKKLPDAWQPDSKRRHGHWRCVEALVAEVRSKARGEGG